MPQNTSTLFKLILAIDLEIFGFKFHRFFELAVVHITVLVKFCAKFVAKCFYDASLLDLYFVFDNFGIIFLTNNCKLAMRIYQTITN